MTSPSSTAPVLVLGATGGQGGAVASALLSSGVPVRALVRETASRGARSLAQAGAELTAGDFTDTEALTTAMRGTAAAFALTTPFESGVDAEVAQGKAIIAAARAAELPYLVFSSVAGALSGTGVPHFESKAAVERQLTAALGRPVAFRQVPDEVVQGRHVDVPRGRGVPGGHRRAAAWLPRGRLDIVRGLGSARVRLALRSGGVKA